MRTKGTNRTQCICALLALCLLCLAVNPPAKAQYGIGSAVRAVTRTGRRHQRQNRKQQQLKQQEKLIKEQAKAQEKQIKLQAKLQEKQLKLQAKLQEKQLKLQAKANKNNPSSQPLQGGNH